MTTGPSTDGPLIEALRSAQRLGVIGEQDLSAAIGHGLLYVDRLHDLASGSRVCDLGSGGGLPGLVIAWDRPDLDIMLIDRRQKRTDLLQVLVGRLDRRHCVSVRCGDVMNLVGDVGAGVVPPMDAVTARSFGPPDVTLGMARQLVTPAGRIVISDPPDGGERWGSELLDGLGLVRSTAGDATHHLSEFRVQQ